MEVAFPYGKTHLDYAFEAVKILTSSIEEYDPGKTEQTLAAEAIEKVKKLVGKETPAVTDGVAVMEKGK